MVYNGRLNIGYIIFNFLKELNLVYRMAIRGAPFEKKIRIVKYFIFRELLKKNIPLTVIMGLTYKCQCSCDFCSVGNYHSISSQNEMSTEEIKACIDELSSLGCLKINFFGGEPLLRKDIIELVSYASGKGLFVFLDTNGLLLDKPMVYRLKSSGISAVAVSLDSHKKIKHDSIRGVNGVFNMAIRGLKYCKEENVPCVVSTIATHNAINSEDLESLIKMSRRIGVTAVRILLPMLSGGWHSQENQLLTKEEIRKVYNYLQPGFVYLENGFSYLNYKGQGRICFAATKRMIYISPDGNVQPCYVFPLSFGNIKHDSLRNILNPMWNSKLFGVTPLSDCIANNQGFRDVLENDYKAAKLFKIHK